MKEGTQRIHFSPRKTFIIKKNNKKIPYIVFAIQLIVLIPFMTDKVELKGFYFQEQSPILTRKYGNPKTK